MDDPLSGGQVFVLAIIAMGIIGGIINKGICLERARLNKRAEGLPAARQTELLTAENERLQGQVSRLEERLSVVERIVTDPARRIAAEIENLR